MMAFLLLRPVAFLPWAATWAICGCATASRPHVDWCPCAARTKGRRSWSFSCGLRKRYNYNYLPPVLSSCLCHCFPLPTHVSNLFFIRPFTWHVHFRNLFFMDLLAALHVHPISIFACLSQISVLYCRVSSVLSCPAYLALSNRFFLRGPRIKILKLLCIRAACVEVLLACSWDVLDLESCPCPSFDDLVPSSFMSSHRLSSLLQCPLSWARNRLIQSTNGVRPVSYTIACDDRSQGLIRQSIAANKAAAPDTHPIFVP